MEHRRHFVRDPRHPIVINDLDVELFLHLDEYRWLHSHHLVDFSGRNKTAVYRRLNRLYHAGYIDRIKNPTNYYPGPGSEPYYLALDNEGARILEVTRGIPYRDRRPAIKNLKTPPSREETRRRRVYNLTHDMLIPSTVTAFIRATRGSSTEVIQRRAIIEKLSLSRDQDTKPFSWVVPVTHNHIADVVGVSPDTVLALHYTELAEGRNRAYLFPEIDTGSEDVYNNDLSVSSIYRKFLAYCGTYEHGLNEKYFAIRSFRVPFLIPDEKRLQEIVRMVERHGVRQLKSFSPRMYIFNYHSVLAPAMDILTGWVDLNGEEVVLKR